MYEENIEKTSLLQIIYQNFYLIWFFSNKMFSGGVYAKSFFYLNHHM